MSVCVCLCLCAFVRLYMRVHICACARGCVRVCVMEREKIQIRLRHLEVCRSDEMSLNVADHIGSDWLVLCRSQFISTHRGVREIE